MKAVNMKLALGPILYYWQRDALFEFYERIAESPVGIVYLGETGVLETGIASDWKTGWQ